MNADNEILALLERWDRQQEAYIKTREARFDIMFEVLGSALGGEFTVIDAACGPGSLSQRLLARFPKAKVIVIDADVMLLEIAHVALAQHADRSRVVKADLSNPTWADLVSQAAKELDAGQPNAIVSTTALHWLSPGALAEFYGVAGELLTPGGIAMNGDHMRFDTRWPTLTTVAKQNRDRTEAEAVASGADDWAAWWARAAAISRLAELKAERDAFFAARPGKRPSSGEDCSVDFHVSALRHAGFTEVGTVWQFLDNYVVFGRKA